MWMILITDGNRLLLNNENILLLLITDEDRLLITDENRLLLLIITDEDRLLLLLLITDERRSWTLIGRYVLKELARSKLLAMQAFLKTTRTID